jgi:hypothetical protein
MIYACPAWKFSAHTHFLKSRRLQDKLLRTISKFPKGTPVCELHMAFQVPYIYNYITTLCWQQEQVIQNYESANAHDITKGEARHIKY